MSNVQYMTAKEIRELGVLQEVNRQLLHPRGMALAMELPEGALRIVDYRNDPEGVRFADDSKVGEPERKAEAFLALRVKRAPARRKALGYIEQPLKSMSPGK